MRIEIYSLIRLQDTKLSLRRYNIWLDQLLTIKDLHVAIDGKEILKGVNLEIKGGEIHAIMGPNGTGKSTLSSAIMGHPKYEVTSGNITLDGKMFLKWK